MGDWVLQLLSMVGAMIGGAGGVYVAIRVDLARMGVIANQADAKADKAHARLDALLMGGRHG